MQKNNNEYETCVKCGIITNVKIKTHIDNRTTYVEGAGQLCNNCYDKIYKQEVKKIWNCLNELQK